MTDGTISGNTGGTWGGGVNVNNANFTMTGGYISGNSAQYGGGMFVGNGTTSFYMIGGSVSNNTCSTGVSGGVYVGGDTVNLTFGGTSQIIGNNRGTGESATKQNLYLSNGKTVAIGAGEAAPTSNMKVGVTLESGTGVFTTQTATADAANYFFADDSSKGVILNDNRLEIVDGHAHNNITFTAWNNNDSLPTTAGNYYLASDVNLSDQWTVPSGTVNLCLNGHVINQGGSNKRVIEVPSGAVLSIYDCDTTTEHKGTLSTYATGHFWTWDGGVDTGTSVIKGGIITGGYQPYGGHGGAGVNVCSGAIFNLYGGSIVGNRNDCRSSSDDGAGVGVNGGTFNMYDGAIRYCYSCNASGGWGGGIFIGNNGIATMSGGIIEDCFAYVGGGVCIVTGEFNFSGGTVTGCGSSYCGGVHANAKTGATLNMSGGTVEKCNGRYAVICDVNSTGNISGGNIVDNNCCGIQVEGNVKISGTTKIKGNKSSGYTTSGGVYVKSTGKLVLGGTTVITDNKDNSGNTNNVFIMSGGLVTLGTGIDIPGIGMNVGVTLPNGIGNVTAVNSDSGDYAKCFISDNAQYIVVKDTANKNIKLIAQGDVKALNVETDTVYDSVQSAVDDATDNQTIQMLEDSTENVTVSEKNITLDLNGKVLNGKGDSSVITISNNANLTLKDSNDKATHTGSFSTLPAGGVITGGRNTHGGGVLILGGTFNMNAGTICKNTATDSGGGVCVGKSDNNDQSVVESHFIMNGGTISDNEGTSWGGGVCVGPGENKKADFVMNGGTVTKNKSKDGGGVHVGGPGSYSVFTMVDGTISENVVSNGGGGGISLYFYHGGSNYAFNMLGGTVSNNTTSSGIGGGVKVFSSGEGTRDIAFGGDAKIIGNKNGSTDENLYLPNEVLVKIGTTLPKTGMSIGVTTQTKPTVGNDINITGTNGADYSSYFISDDPAYSVKNDNNIVKLMKELTSWQKLQKALNGTTTSSVDNLFEITGDTIKLLNDFNAESGDTTLTVSGTKVLDLNGYTINGKIDDSTSVGSVIKVPSGATLTLEDNSASKAGKITGGNAVFGGGVDVSTGDGDTRTAGGTFIMKGGTITGNKGGEYKGGGGVYVNGGVFSMSGNSVISGNSGNYGGGVYVKDAEFAMSENSKIANNNAKFGGGLCSEGSNATVTINDGSIEGNTSYIGGGASINYGTFSMYGGSICNNAANHDGDNGGGLYVGVENITLGGTAKITGNTVCGRSNNVFLMRNKTIAVNIPDSTMSIGLSMLEPGVFTSDSAEGYLGYFSADDSNCKVIYDTNKKLKLAKKYNVTIDSAITNGTVTTDAADGKAFEGDTVTVTATPSSGYILNSLKYNDGTEDHDITTTKSFTMPSMDVTITAMIVKKPDPKPTPDPKPGPQPTSQPDDPVVTPTAPPQGSYAETGLTTKRYVPNGGTTAGIGSVLGTNENQVPLPYVTKESEKAGWTSIDQALKSYKKTKESKTEPFNVTMNGYATVDNQLLSDVNTQKVDLALNLDNDVVVVVPKENKVINDAIKNWNAENALKATTTSLQTPALTTQALVGQAPATQLLTAQTQQPKLSDDVYFKVSAITTNDAKANRMTNAGLDMKDIQAIGGDANTPVVKIVTSNTSVGILKSQMIQILFDTTKMTVKYKPGDIVYLYNGSAKAGVGCYTVGTVDKDGKVSFWVPMVSSYWTIGNKNLGSKIMKRK